MTKKTVASKAVRLILLLACSGIFLFPLYLALVNALGDWYSPPALVPKVWNWENYAYATSLIDFWRYTRNSLILSGITVILSTLSSGISGYAFARIKAPGKNILFMLVLSTMMLPGIVTQIPTYVLFYKFNILNTYLPWVFWGIGGNAFYIFMYRQFFLSLPPELEEAARIDGCSIFKTYWRIILPVSIPAAATVGILTFHGSWNDVVSPFMYLREEKYPLATALSMIGYMASGSTQVITQVSVAAGLILAVPIIATFFVGQRYIVQGIVTTGLKS